MIVIGLGGLERDPKTQNQLELELFAPLKVNVKGGNVGMKYELVEIVWVEADVAGWEKSDFSSQNFY